MFQIQKNSKLSKARLGLIKTKRGEIATPFFMPDATRAVVKNLDNESLLRIGLPAMVVNTYHLYLQPGTELIKKAKGVNKFMNWKKPLLSDSGGFQVFSLIHKNKQMGKIFDDRVEFRSPIDGSKHILTPERSIQIQFDLGVDMIVAFDDCPPNDYDDKAIAKAVERTIAWAERCQIEYGKQIKKRKITAGNRPLFFGVIQGGMNNELREKCARELVKIGFDGYGFGARPVDKDGNFLGEILQLTADLIPEDQLRFGLGIGLPEDIVRCAAMGWDMFDCVIPTREGRHGRLFRRKSKFQIPISKKQKNEDYSFYETFNITNAKFSKDFSPINKVSKLDELREYSKAYLHHLFKVSDPLGTRLASLNNLEFYTELMGEIRRLIKTGKF